jgi:16S rRNA (guanine966-N2)-methyltransferase
MPSSSSNPANQVRIIGGQYRRRILHFPDLPGLRPTPDRVRETLFNWLGQELPGLSCLDAFAGSGALGFEAASRHASRVLLLESSRQVCEALRHSRDLFKAGHVEICQADALAWMRAAAERFDVIFLDPPFSSGLIDLALPLAIKLLKPEGWIYVEQADHIQPPEGFIIHREGKAGQSRFALLRRA